MGFGVGVGAGFGVGFGVGFVSDSYVDILEFDQKKRADVRRNEQMPQEMPRCNKIQTDATRTIHTDHPF